MHEPVNAHHSQVAVAANGRWCREEELQAVMQVAADTGIVLDPVYSGKAVHQMLCDMWAHPKEWEGSNVLFVHTGGLLGMYDKLNQLQPLVQALGRCRRLPL
jgi:D-cysteine desulfhydrase